MADHGFNPERKRTKIPKGIIHKKEENDIHTAPIEFSSNGCSVCVGDFIMEFICIGCGKLVPNVVKEEK